MAASISGTVTDAVTLQPVGGVSVKFQLSTGPVQAVTGATGEYSTEIDIPEMELTAISINHPGYQPFNDTQAVTPGEEHEFDFNLQPV